MSLTRRASGSSPPSSSSTTTATSFIATSNEDPDCEFDEANRMLYRNVDGVLVIPAAPMRGPTRLLSPELNNLTIVSLDRPLDGNRYDSVLVQNRNGGQLGTNHLIALGHKRIAFISLDGNLYTCLLYTSPSPRDRQ